MKLRLNHYDLLIKPKIIINRPIKAINPPKISIAVQKFIYPVVMNTMRQFLSYAYNPVMEPIRKRSNPRMNKYFLIVTPLNLDINLYTIF